MESEFGTLIKFRSQRRIALSSKAGKTTEITIQPYEYIDIDKNTGKFFVKNHFTNSKIKLLDPNSELHVMDLKRVGLLIDLAKRSEGATFIEK